MSELNDAVPAIAKALSKRGYETLTPVQQAMLNPDLNDSDALVSAKTGSGKTVAFGMAMASTLLPDGAERFGRAETPLALVIAPTRELAMQVKREFEWLYEMTGAVIASCVGGMDIRSERRVLERGAHIVVGTPGRICDHIRRNALDMSAVRVAVLDEADEMLDLGFREDLEYILEQAPDDRRTLMFSATVPAGIARLAKQYQRDAKRIEVASEEKQHADIEYRALMVAPSDRENAIVNVLRFYEARNAIVFCSTRANVNHLTARLSNRNFSVVALSGELTQNERTHALQAMRDGRARVCIATDVAARGIDLPGLELVIHADLPTNSETLLHRSGRTGRAGNKGISAFIVPLNQRRKAERLLMGATVTPAWVLPPSAEEVIARDHERLVADPVFAEEVREEEQDLVATLVSTYGAEKLAAAFVNLHRNNNAAPEDLIEISIDSPGRKTRERGTDRPGGRGEEGESFPSTPRTPRGDFGPAIWLSLSVGRKQNAEPRWLIPMLCRNGNITKAGIGAIKMQQTETYVELSTDVADQFLQAIGPNRMLERGVRVTVLDAMPDLSRQAEPRTFEKRSFDERPPRRDVNEAAPRQAKREDWTRDDKGREAWSKDKPKAKPAYAGGEGRETKSFDKPFRDKPLHDKPAGDRPFQDKPFKKDGKPAFKDGGKPSFKDGGKPPFKEGGKPSFRDGGKTAKPAAGKGKPKKANGKDRWS
ncbi:DEAD/DEAH box helicase [Rhizobium sp. SSA_523]|uniref:DEAD/DEAH box helicase n=1 Tax=Rhizobium sp. SSA_523 TaxID=2952477 RepID=UPI002091587F|nr:DEAD/DEAH box helicase [Rhizobium sp. SSA_523]MCO5730509.1 DEAD/DEAH box helicase [Rhizobium sp. SSA_523]WKC25547.1 DEAD/DEAH box helicase [Rhizobium sp. SSA_523]